MNPRGLLVAALCLPVIAGCGVATFEEGLSDGRYTIADANGYVPDVADVVVGQKPFESEGGREAPGMADWTSFTAARTEHIDPKQCADFDALRRLTPEVTEPAARNDRIERVGPTITNGVGRFGATLSVREFADADAAADYGLALLAAAQRCGVPYKDSGDVPRSYGSFEFDSGARDGGSFITVASHGNAPYVEDAGPYNSIAYHYVFAGNLVVAVEGAWYDSSELGVDTMIEYADDFVAYVFANSTS